MTFEGFGEMFAETWAKTFLLMSMGDERHRQASSDGERVPHMRERKYSKVLVCSMSTTNIFKITDYFVYQPILMPGSSKKYYSYGHL